MTDTFTKPATEPFVTRRAAASGASPVMEAPFDPASMADMPLTRLLHYWFEEVWGRGNLNAVSDIMRRNTLISGSVSALAEPESDYSEVVAALRNLLGPIKVTFTHVMETDEWVSVRLVAATSNPRDGEPFEITGQVMARVEDGRIAEMHSNMDYFRMFEMLGQLPPEALAICLTGERLG
ncbi:nuclear transport factor 2 family protein [Leisingera aquaemixtae]|uniref:nuclear transport factor 2 family protein n=1 Tax=Leisingera aquaemixtae TaxID=1396826 RepID=UPI0021A29A9E|nr:nuclear transport factor 2 family protein [Leisingera aquaemixtae]UWQ23287.1 nuclear transport factor 2 family protein [Leisingera aquaemixtae]UWQ35802.1 nuclear transport factor 2 family protein [Leisingera aquaemixtae]UWQ44163.1 nuclear transport factor 2 family protein [Leisingera aquaemixtae]